MKDQRPQIIRGTIDGKAKYCRIPVRSKLYETMQEGGELSAEAILSMPHEKAVAVIDAIMADWFYWMRRAGEYFVQIAPQQAQGTVLYADKEGGGEDGNLRSESRQPAARVAGSERGL